MSNYDVLVTNAAPYHNPMISTKARMALKIYAMAIEFSGTTDYTTSAGQKTLVQKAVTALAGMPSEEFPKEVSPQDIALWFKTAESANSALATASISSKLAAIPYLLSLDDEILAKTVVFMTGVALSPLT